MIILRYSWETLIRIHWLVYLYLRCLRITRSSWLWMYLKFSDKSYFQRKKLLYNLPKKRYTWNFSRSFVNSKIKSSDPISRRSLSTSPETSVKTIWFISSQMRVSRGCSWLSKSVCQSRCNSKGSRRKRTRQMKLKYRKAMSQRSRSKWVLRYSMSSFACNWCPFAAKANQTLPNSSVKERSWDLQLLSNSTKK